MQTTTNIGLKTYEANDPTDWLGEFNYNMNKIDTAVGTQNDAIEVIEETASTAVTTANTASTTASEALTTAEGKTSVNDNVASATTTYSSNKINELISGIQPGTEIDDTVTSTTKTWSSSKINTEVFNNRKIIEYLHSGKIYSLSPIADIIQKTSLANYNDNELSYTVTEDSIVLGTFIVFATALVNKAEVAGDYSPSFIKNDYSNSKNYFDLADVSVAGTYESGIHYINTIPTIIKAGSTIKLYPNNMSYKGSQIFSRVEIRLKTISSILNS